ncbi:MFS transporter [Tumebacillus permanentifrigoris]|uniref:Transmembrane secretion effector n=1 Tax=Tumebacillus permanentifrigoris TaxID=378543 RepID=A0A316D6Z7_9BACL|nr:MFS transporter [Tumebacillus permanentifrigoris]PWK09062.1 transmembrane secretion effector [Tumebacillus permanentifrigoris]
MTYRELLRHRGYSLLFSGQVLSQLGDAIYEVGIVWLVYRMTGSASALGWLAFCQSVPFLICGLLAGAFVDRWDRRLTMLVSDLVRGVAVVYLAVRYAYGSLTLAEVCAAAVVLTTARAFFHPAMRALYPAMLKREQLLLANSLSEGAKRICKIGGMVLGGVLMAQAQGGLVLWVNAMSFFLSMLTVYAFGKTPSTASGTGRDKVAAPGRLQKSRDSEQRSVRMSGSIFREIGSAFREVYNQRMVFYAILISSLGLVISTGLIKVGLPLLAGVVLQGEGDEYGVLMACFSVGMFMSAASMRRLARQFTILQLVGVGWLCYGAMLFLLSFAPTLWMACLVVGATGFAHFLTDIPVTTLIQQTMPMHRMSACQSVWATASFGSESVGVALGGTVLGFATIGVCFSSAGGLLLLLGLVALIKLRGNGQNVLDRQTLSE